MVKVTVSGASTQQSTLEAEVIHRALELARSGIGISRRQGCKTLEAGGMTDPCIGDKVIHALRRLNSLSFLQIVKTRRGQRKHLDVDALLVHYG